MKDSHNAIQDSPRSLENLIVAISMLRINVGVILKPKMRDVAMQRLARTRIFVVFFSA